LKNSGLTLRQGGVGLFYYAGHGIQVAGRNYLIPVDALLETESDIKYEAVDAGRVLGKMEDAANPVNIIILDACRDNPFARSFRSSSMGLARMDNPKGSILVYATSPGSVAAEGSGRNGVYTGALLRQMEKPGLRIEDVLKQTRIDVMRSTGEKQVPWEASSLTGNFYFIAEKVTVSVGQPVKVQKPSKVDAELVEERRSLEKKKLELEKLRLEIEQQKLEAEKKRLSAQKSEQASPDKKSKQSNKEKHELSQRKSFRNSIGMEFVLISGSPFGDFYMQTTEVTQEQWHMVMDNNPSHHRDYGFRYHLPVENVTWNDVQAFIAKLNQKETGIKYRLPSEAEWIFTCCGSDGDTCEFETIDKDEVAWSEKISRLQTHPTGTKRPNKFGIYDMRGNVFEWVQDDLDNGFRRKILGGSYSSFHKTASCKYENDEIAFYFRNDIGFRLLAEK
jgi:formylglycine-generating enzyme required for sulfatase activity